MFFTTYFGRHYVKIKTCNDTTIINICHTNMADKFTCLGIHISSMAAMVGNIDKPGARINCYIERHK